MSEKHDRLSDLKIDRADIESTRSGGGLALAAIAVLLVGLSAGGWWWYAKGQVALVTVAPVVEVSDSAAEVRSDSVLDASGYVTARRRATVSSKITAKIVQVLIEEGMRVEQGQVLARLDDSSQTRQLALAEAELGQAKSSLVEIEVLLKEARLNLGRIKELVTANVSSQRDLDRQQAEVESLEARLALVREQMNVAEKRIDVRRQDLVDTIIEAPFDGVVVTKDAQPGEMISPVSAGGGFTRTGIGTVVDMSSLEIEVDVNEAYINRVRPGQKVEANLDAYPDWKIPATVITSVPTADRQKATVRVRIGFEALDSRILPDMGVKVAFLDDTPPEPVTAASETRWEIPAAALRKDGDQDYVFVFRGERAERRTVQVGSQRGDRATIISGLAAGENVVVDGPDELVDGAKIRTE